MCHSIIECVLLTGLRRALWPAVRTRLADMITNTVTPDRSKIIIEHDDHVKYWTRHFGVTKDELTRAIERVGNSAAAVRKQLSAARPPAT